ncbi:MAG TPA: ABC-2 family transporter protein [Acidimicrobiales bacterium]|nr:ABC-2 family transporter protein [Acidimicrobiales bacterium]
MRLFYEVAKRAFRRYSTYRSAAIGGTITSTVFGVIRASILLAVFRQQGRIGDFDARDAVTFAIIGQAMLHMGLMGGHLPLADRIVSGDIVTDLYRPVDLQRFELATDLGRALYQGVSRCFLTIGVGALIFDLRIAAYPRTLGLFAVSILLANVANFGHKFLVTLTTFWTLDYRAPSQMATVIAMFFSGFAVPVVLFPSWLEDLCRLLPYVGFSQIPLEVLLGKLHGPELVAALGSQLVWCVLLLLGGRGLLARATRRVVVQGG